MNQEDDVLAKSIPVITADESTFDEAIKEGNVIVDFWAEWCEPCKRIAPMLEYLAEKYNGKIKIVKVDTDANPNLSMKYNISSIPNLYFFKNGEVVDNQVGAYPLPVLESNMKNAFDMNDEAATALTDV